MIPEKFSRDLAAGINKFMAAPSLRNRMAQAGRQRAEDHFSWLEEDTNDVS